MRAIEKVGRRLARAANTADLDDLAGLKRKIIGGRDDLGGDRVMSAALAQRRLAAAILLLRQPDSVDIRRLAVGRLDFGGHYVYSLGEFRIAGADAWCLMLEPDMPIINHVSSIK